MRRYHDDYSTGNFSENHRDWGTEEFHMNVTDILHGLRYLEKVLSINEPGQLQSTRKSDQDGWTDEDEKFSKFIIEKFFKSVTVSTEEYVMVKEWLELLKQKLQ